MWKALGLSGCQLLLLLLLSIGEGNGNPLQCSCLENLRVSTADLYFGGSHHPHCHYQAKFYYSLSHCQPGSAESHLDCLVMFILLPSDVLHSSVSKESACKAEVPGSILELGRSHGEGNGNPLQYSCLENSMDREAQQATIHGVTRVRHDLLTIPSNHIRPLSSSHVTLVNGGHPCLPVEHHQLARHTWNTYDSLSTTLRLLILSALVILAFQLHFLGYLPGLNSPILYLRTALPVHLHTQL